MDEKEQNLESIMDSLLSITAEKPVEKEEQDEDEVAIYSYHGEVNLDTPPRDDDEDEDDDDDYEEDYDYDDEDCYVIERESTLEDIERCVENLSRCMHDGYTYSEDAVSDIRYYIDEALDNLQRAYEMC